MYCFGKPGADGQCGRPFCFFAVFIICRYFWLEQSFFAFKKANGFWQGEFSLSPFVGVILIVAAAVVIFFNQFLNLRLNERMYPLQESSEKIEVIENEE